MSWLKADLCPTTKGEVNTSGRLRVRLLKGMYYVVGGGWCLPATSEESACELLDLLEGRRDVIDEYMWKEEKEDEVRDVYRRAVDAEN